MADDDNVLFVRGNGNKNKDDDDSDVWDDSALIKAYDKAVNLAKEKVAKRMGTNVQGSQSKQKKQFCRTNKVYKKWTVGAPCRATYSGDGEVYEAIVTKVYENSDSCIVKFVGYGNTEKVELCSLLESEGLQSQIAQQKDALATQITEETLETPFAEANIEVEDEPNVSSTKNCKRYNGIMGEKMDCEGESTKGFAKTFMTAPSFNSPLDMMPPAPPLPPQLMAKLPENDADALSSMLMSWYISGFHTGYYHGLKQAQNNQGKRKNC